jgi:hypothetical protein
MRCKLTFKKAFGIKSKKIELVLLLLSTENYKKELLKIKKTEPDLLISHFSIENQKIINRRQNRLKPVPMIPSS